MDEWKSSNQMIKSFAGNLENVLKAIQIMIDAEKQKVENMEKTIKVIKEQNGKRPK